MKLTRLSAALLMCAMPVLATAHPGHSQAHSALAEGLLHPLTGLDHALALFAVGLLSVRNQAVRWMLPVTFIAAMIVGVGAAQSGWQFASAEGIMSTSIFLLGILILTPREPMPVIQRSAVAILCLFAVAHGYAHGVETSHANSTQSTLNILGLLISTALLTTLGVAVGLKLKHQASLHQTSLHHPALKQSPALIAFGTFMTLFGLTTLL